MRRDLDEKLCAKYPEIFRDRHKPMTETAMCWGFACGDGWYPLIDTLCHLIMSDVRMIRRDLENTRRKLAQPDLDDWGKQYYTQERLEKLEKRLKEAEDELPIAGQVKEKFGTLRFYVDRGNDRQHAYINFAECMSATICEECGATKDVHQTIGWVRTTCVPCAKKNNLMEDLDIPETEQETDSSATP